MSPDASYWLEHDFEEDGWTVAYRLGAEHGRPIIHELRIFPLDRERKEPGEWSHGSAASTVVGGLKARLLRKVRTEEALDVLERFEGAIEQLLASSAPYELLSAASATTSLRGQGIVTLSSGGSVGRPRLTETYLSRLAKTYVTAVDNGDRKPIETLAKWLTLEGLSTSDSAIRDQLRKAEAADLLDRQGLGRGRPGGRLTDKAQRILDAEESSMPLRDVQYWSGRTS